MYFVLTLYALFIGALGESCTTPSGQKGECVPLRSCSSLLWSFSNYKFGGDAYLQDFVCSNDELGLIVCCRVATDFLVFENEEDDYDVNDYQNVKLENTKNCGISTNLEISDGVARLHNFPWLVKIMAVNNSYIDYEDRGIEKVVCSGVLINERYVLYSAYCHHSVLLPNGPDYFTRIDSYDNKEAGCNEMSYSPKCRKFEIFETDRIIVHPFYDSKTQLNNIAMLMINRRVQLSDYIRPICLHTSGRSIKEGEILYTAGWNRTYSLSDISVKILETSMYVSNSNCKNTLPKNDDSFSLLPYEMCTSNAKNNIDKNIIGLPLMSLEGNRWYLEGFESQGDSTKVYTRVQNYLQWIQGNLGGELCEIPNNTQKGECVHIGFCPKMLKALANPAPEDEDALIGFTCRYGYESITDPKYVLKVCCGFTPDYTILPGTVNKDLDVDVSDFSYCGLQHRDDYFSTDDTISVDEFPWLAIIINATLREQRDKVCGGSLITDRYVLTSGQCNYWFNEEDVMLVRLGDYNLKNSSDCIELTQYGSYDCSEVQEYGVEKKIIHPFFNKFTFYNDIALLRLNKKVIYSDYVRPICVPRSENDLAQPGETLFTTGFGDFDRHGKDFGVKKKIRTRHISNEECQARFHELSFITPVTEFQMCTEDLKNSTDVNCIGDEGGPVMYSKKLRWFIQGVSSSYGCGNDNVPQNFLKVYKYLDWIKFNIRNTV